MAKKKVVFAGREIDGEDLSDAETQAVLRTVFDYIVWPNAFLNDLFTLNKNEIIATAEVAKSKFDAAVRGALAADNEVGIQLLRPGHILRSTSSTETPSNSWSISFSSGNQYWIGFSTSYGTAMNVSQYLVLLILGIVFTQGAAPVIEELQPKIGNTDYPWLVLRHSWLGDSGSYGRVRACRFHPMLAEARQTMLWQVNAMAAGTQEMVLLGLAMGPGRYLRKASYAAADLP